MILFPARPVPAQTADTAIRGTVVDASGAVVPGASVEIAQPATGFARTVTTNSSGDYELRYLVPGSARAVVTLLTSLPGRMADRVKLRVAGA